MRLKTIKLAGFKSFVEPTVINLESQLTAVVGPNGCGKSNIVDAIRWVIGESSAKYLRAESMASVIFNGTATRQPVAQASIELIFDNSDARIGGKYASFTDISVRRVLNRDGQSQYYLNGTRCRRRDITDLFLGTGLGSRSYAIIEQGMISRIIEAKPEELSNYLKEVSGISVYEERRRETENRIRRTRDNLERLTDLREEVSKQLSHLKRQANAARRYKKLMEEARLLEAQLNSLHWRELQNQIASTESELQVLDLKLTAKITEQRRLDAEIEKFRDAQTDQNERFNEVQSRFYRLGADIARLEQRIQHSRERREQLEQDLLQIDANVNEVQQHITEDTLQLDELKKELATLEPDAVLAGNVTEQSQFRLHEVEEKIKEWQFRWDEFVTRSAKSSQQVEVEQTRIQHLQQQVETSSQRTLRLQNELGTLDFNLLPNEITDIKKDATTLDDKYLSARTNLSELSRKISQQRASVSDCAKLLASQRETVQKFHGRQASLKAIQEASHAKQDTYTTQWLEEQQLQNCSKLAQYLKVEPGWEKAVEIVLGPYLEGLCINDKSDLLNKLAHVEKGKMTFIFQQKSKVNSQSVNADLLSNKINSNWTPYNILAGIFVADSYEHALEVFSRLNENESVVTKDGVWLSKNSVRINKTTDGNTGVITLEVELEKLNQQILKAQEKLSAIETEHEEGQKALSQFEHEHDEGQDLYAKLTSELNECRSRIKAKESKFDHIKQRKIDLEREIDDAKSQLEEANTLLVSTQATLLKAKEKQGAETDMRTKLLQERDDYQSNLDDVKEQAKTDRETADELNIRLESTRNQAHFLGQSIDRANKQLLSLGERRKLLHEAKSNADSPVEDIEDELEQTLGKRLGKQKPTQSRAYTSDQIHEVQRFLTPNARLASQIILESGCRAKDLATLRLASEAPLKHARLHKLDPNRFIGRETWIQIKFIGKGGHEYLSTISPRTADQLATIRLGQPKDFKERGQTNTICYQYYDLIAGKYLSEQWSKASVHALGFSHGIHGLRHTYAQQRIFALLELGIPLIITKQWTAQTLGHYRGDVINTYLR